jgi:hypothetical protein
MTEQAAGPSGSGTVMLELGPGIGALVLRTPAELDGAEIELSRPDGGRTHSRVRPRHTGSGTSYAAVYPALAAGEYTVLADDMALGERHPLPSPLPAPFRVRIAEGAVTTATLS